MTFEGKVIPFQWRHAMENIKIYLRNFLSFHCVFAKTRQSWTKVTDTDTETGKPLAIGQITDLPQKACIFICMFTAKSITSQQTIQLMEHPSSIFCTPSSIFGTRSNLVVYFASQTVRCFIQCMIFLYIFYLYIINEY